LGALGLSLWEARSVPILFVSYVISAFLLAIPMQRATTLTKWDTSHLLMVGNEHTGDRPWKGIVSEFFVAGRAATPEEVSRILDDRSPRPALGDSLIVYYKKDGANGYYDEIGSAPPLLAKIDHRKNQSSGWFETSEPASYLTSPLARTSQFTLGATVSAQNGNQKGPARIISLSKDGNTRNFTLGQADDDLVFRLRTPLAGLNGNRPELRVPSVFRSSEVRHIIVTFDARKLLVYVDGRKSAQYLDLTPGLFAYNFIFQNDLPRSQAAHLLFYAVIFSPAGIMLLLTLKEMRLHSGIGMVSLGGLICFLMSVSLEALLVLVSGRQARFENVVFGLVFCYLAFLAAYLFPPKNIRSVKSSERLGRGD
jgi:hypothetical protein